MNNYDNIDLEMEESLSVRVEEPIRRKKNTVYLWLRRIFTLDDELNEKHYYPIFIIFVSVLHISIHLLRYISSRSKDPSLSRLLYDGGKRYLPCMRPASDDIRLRKVACGLLYRNITCNYDDILRKKCFSFMYPHQLWRMITSNLLHVDWSHLKNNVSLQLLYGIPLERKYGSIRIVIIYWLCTLSASLAFTMLRRIAIGIGASGAVYGLQFFFIMERLMAIKTNTDQRRRLFIVIQLLLMVVVPKRIAIFTMNYRKVSIGHAAHFGGGLMGFLLGIGMFGCPWPWNNENCISQRICRRLTIVFVFLYFLMTVTIFFLRDAPSMERFLYGI
ncbi:unnamed protein product [Adineta steineri]|uniref:rhomboid protease n=1 Tax=Adineta steineri TaxID=433720 RepID=A0A815K919_9BILA|nr:unnamed protein product [Adineta steineri]CAF1391119.1 unnamed protein product [Adineta steineri]CAF1392517.1 unnamed protein product [Adineta steineri]